MMTSLLTVIEACSDLYNSTNTPDAPEYAEEDYEPGD